MKKMTKVMSVLLAAAMLLTMTACGGPADNGSSTAPSTTTKPNGNVPDGKINYTVKEKNKILLKTADKNKVANKIAQYYNEELRKAGYR